MSKEVTMKVIIKLLSMAILMGTMVIWIMMPTSTYKKIWLASMRAKLGKTTYFGKPGVNLLVYMFPMILLAFLGCIYLHLKKQTSVDSGVESRKRDKFGALRRPMLVKGPLGIVTVTEVMFLTMFMALLLWSLANYFYYTFVTITPHSAAIHGDNLWEARLDSIAVRLGVAGNICLAFLFYPVARGSSLLAAVGLTSESSIKYHIWLGHLVMTLFTSHGLCYVIYWMSTNQVHQSQTKIVLTAGFGRITGPLWTILVRVGNGLNCRFWTDHWSPFGSIKDYWNVESGSRMGLPWNATLASLFSQGHWILPNARTERQINLHVYLTTLVLTTEEDNYEWIIDGKLNSKYSTGQVYTQLTEEAVTVPWAKIVWITGGIPKHSFLTWLFMLDRCPTRDRLAHWGLQTDSQCLLCNTTQESRNHLFFECNFTWQIWFQIVARLGFSPRRHWNDLTLQLQTLQGNKYYKRLIIICWQGAIHWLWGERNSRLHRGTYRSTDVIIGLINRQVKERLLSFRFSNPQSSSALMQLWLSPSSTSSSTLATDN